MEPFVRICITLALSAWVVLVFLVAYSSVHFVLKYW